MRAMALPLRRSPRAIQYCPRRDPDAIAAPPPSLASHSVAISSAKAGSLSGEGPLSCKRKGRSTLGRVALDFVNPKSILETNNGLGVNLTNPAFR